MLGAVTHVSTCRLCEGPLDLVVAFERTPPGDQYLPKKLAHTTQATYPLDLMLCRACGAVQLADTVDPALIYPEYLYTTSVSKGLTEHYGRYAADVIRRLDPKPDDLVVDIGSNDGTLLKAFQGRGLQVLGVDPAMDVALRASASGIPTQCAFFTQPTAKITQHLFGSAQIITANHVLANVSDLHDFTRGIKTLLALDGTFVFETGYWPAIVDGNLIDTIEHEHIHYFAVAPLQRFFRRHGLELVSVEEQATKGGSLRGYVRHVGMGKPDASVAELITDEGAGGYADPYRLAQWAAQLGTLERQMKQAIEKADDEVWVGYGAAVGSTLLLHQFGLGDKLTCLVDANPQKQGRLSPGYHLHVVNPSELQLLNPDRIVILAWRYAAMIQAQHPEFAGRFILPLPQMGHA